MVLSLVILKGDQKKCPEIFFLYSFIFQHYILTISHYFLLVIVLLGDLVHFLLDDSLQPLWNRADKLLAQILVQRGSAPSCSDFSSKTGDVLKLFSIQFLLTYSPHILYWPYICHLRCLKVIGDFFP